MLIGHRFAYELHQAENQLDSGRLPMGYDPLSIRGGSAVASIKYLTYE